MPTSAKDFPGEGEYKIAILGRNIEVTNTIRDYIEEKVHKLEKVTHHILEVDVRLDIQKLNHLVDIVMKFSHFKIKVHAVTENMYSAIDKAFERMHAKLRKWKERIQDHHAKGVSATEMEINVLERGSDDDDIIEENNIALAKQYDLPKVMKTKTRPLKMLRLDEAVMKMELSDDHFLVYRSEEEQMLKVIYRRRDGSYGIISPE